MYKVNKAKPVLYKGQNRKLAAQLISFSVEDLDDPVFLSYLRVKENTNIGIEEIEILKGCDVRFEFYKKGEVMFNGEVCKSGSLVKDFWIETPESIEELRADFEASLPSKRILEVFNYTGRRGKQLVGFDIGEKKPTFIAKGSLISATGMEGHFRILEGSYIAPEYYQKGDELWNGEICKKSNVLLKDLNLRVDGSLEQLLQNAKSKRTQKTSKGSSTGGKSSKQLVKEAQEEFVKMMNDHGAIKT
jgi:hypothetical protein